MKFVVWKKFMDLGPHHNVDTTDTSRGYLVISVIMSKYQDQFTDLSSKCLKEETKNCIG